jgi:hypothetical protein
MSYLLQLPVSGLPIIAIINFNNYTIIDSVLVLLTRTNFKTTKYVFFCCFKTSWDIKYFINFNNYTIIDSVLVLLTRTNFKTTKYVFFCCFKTSWDIKCLKNPVINNVKAVFAGNVLLLVHAFTEAITFNRDYY